MCRPWPTQVDATLMGPGAPQMAKTKQPQGPSLIIKRTVKVAGRKSSVSLEDPFWKGLKKIAATKGLTLQDLISKIDKERQHANLSSAIRLFVLDYYCGQV